MYILLGKSKDLLKKETDYITPVTQEKV